MACTLRPQSARRAQVQKKCGLCETEICIQYRCVQCQKYMCEKCNKIHLNVQTSVKHEIIEISSIKTHDIKTDLATNNITCGTHKDKLCVKYCYECIELVCKDCISDIHKDHDLDDINEGCTFEIIHLQGRLSKDLWFCENELKLLQKSTEMCNSLSDILRQKIDVRETEMKEEIKKYANQLRVEIVTKNDHVKKEGKASQKKISEFKEILKDREFQLKTAKESNRADTITTALKQIQKQLPNLDFNQLPQEISDFLPGNMTVTKLFGSVQSKPITKEQSNIYLQVIKSYTTDLFSVHRLLILGNNTALISNYKMNTLRKINIDNKIKPLKENSIKVYGMSMTANKDLLLSYCNSSDVYLLAAKTGELKPFLSVSPLYTFGIHVTKHSEIILGVKEVGGTFTLGQESCRKVIIFGMDGKQRIFYEYDKHKHRLFTIPSVIRSNVNNDILVIDSISERNGRVVVLDREGQVNWTYQGHVQVNSKDELFCPVDLVTSPVGHVIVCDCNAHALHIISEQGDILTCKVMEDQGITYPCSLDVDTRGMLWVGCHSGDENKCNAKICFVQNSLYI